MNKLLFLFLILTFSSKTFSQDNKAFQDTTKSQKDKKAGFGAYLNFQSRILTHSSVRGNSFTTYGFGVLFGKNQGKVFLQYSRGSVELQLVSGNEERFFLTNFILGYQVQSPVSSQVELKARFGFSFLDAITNAQDSKFTSLGMNTQFGVILKNKKDNAYGFASIGFCEQKPNIENKTNAQSLSGWTFSVGVGF
jgi:hypothetical protein